jgi:hypothetical protein
MSVSRKFPLRSILLVGAGIAFAACEADRVSLLDPAPSGGEALEATVKSSVPIVTFPGGMPSTGTSELSRAPNGVNFRLTKDALEPGNVYTLWLVVFNEPSECLFGPGGAGPSCGADDIGTDLARPDVLWVAGRMASGQGTATFAGRRSVGDGSSSMTGPAGLPAYGLEDPVGAEIHFALHHHGPVIPEYLPDMLRTIDGGCTDAGVPAAGVPSPFNDYAGPLGGAYGRRGPNTCGTFWVALHLP